MTSLMRRLQNLKNHHHGEPARKGVLAATASLRTSRKTTSVGVAMAGSTNLSTSSLNPPKRQNQT